MDGTMEGLPFHLVGYMQCWSTMEQEMVSLSISMGNKYLLTQTKQGELFFQLEMV